VPTGISYIAHLLCPFDTAIFEDHHDYRMMKPCACRAKRALSLFIAGSLAFAAVSDAVAQAAPRKKASTSEAAKPKKKARSTETPDANSSAQASKTKGVAVESQGVPFAKPTGLATVSIASEELLEFHAQPAGVRTLIESSLALARQNLTYTFGSADPAKGGLDCSGFIYYVLRQHGLTQVPRDSSGLYVWVRKAHGFRAVIGRKSDSFEMDELLPGDLLFWIGTYVTDHDPPVTHTMIYLGTEKSTGAKIMIGSSDGRSYRGERRSGVSVFDFTMPRTPAASEQRATFIGYARIPGLRD
jgi:cell wall-associated NlpC family hydrolase